MSHDCNNLVLTCIDFRFEKNYNDFVASLDGGSDRIALAGGAKSIVDEDSRQTVLKQIEISKRLHNSNTIYLVDHEDCGAYGGKGNLTDKEEKKQHSEVFKKAIEIIKDAFPQMKIKIYFSRLSGEVEIV